ncbi:MAG TPA: tetratricopeptide repeat protein [Methylophilaceae bacterium]|nr:tetratricopeptide repeat protein [Methylophilaceae bacterium]
MQFRFLTLALFIALSTQVKAEDAKAEEESAVSKIEACNKAIKEGDASKALAYAGQVLKLDANNREALLCKGRAHGGTGQNKEALTALQAAEKLSSNPLEHMVALTLIGNVQTSDKQFSEAIASYQASLALAQKAGNTRFERIDHNLIGDAYVANNQLEQGLKSYLVGSQLAANGNEHADSYERIAATYSALGKYDLAVEHQIKAVLAETGNGDLDHQANAGLELGRYLTQAGDYLKAERAINKVVNLSKENGGAYWEAKSYYYLGITKTASNQTADARKLLQDAQRISDEIGEQELSGDIKLALAKLPK